jgi:hypothetical protein
MGGPASRPNARMTRMSHAKGNEPPPTLPRSAQGRRSGAGRGAAGGAARGSAVGTTNGRPQASRPIRPPWLSAISAARRASKVGWKRITATHSPPRNRKARWQASSDGQGSRPSMSGRQQHKRAPRVARGKECPPPHARRREEDDELVAEKARKPESGSAKVFRYRKKQARAPQTCAVRWVSGMLLRSHGTSYVRSLVTGAGGGCKTAGAHFFVQRPREGSRSLRNLSKTSLPPPVFILFNGGRSYCGPYPPRGNWGHQKSSLLFNRYLLPFAQSQTLKLFGRFTRGPRV